MKSDEANLLVGVYYQKNHRQHESEQSDDHASIEQDRYDVLLHPARLRLSLRLRRKHRRRSLAPLGSIRTTLAAKFARLIN